MEISAVDAAQNIVKQNLMHNWTVAYEASVQYTRFRTAPLGPVSISNQTFEFEVSAYFLASHNLHHFCPICARTNLDANSHNTE